MKMDYQGFGHGMIEIAVYISRIIWAALLFGGLAMAGLFAVFFPFLAFIGGPLTFIYGVIHSVGGLLWSRRVLLAPYAIYCVYHPEELRHQLGINK